MDGILNVDKPAGNTSYSVVARIKRLSGERRVGHAGTLDPDATGILPICLGKATRIVEYLTGTNKTYRACIELGAITDTYDASGKFIHKGDASGIDRSMIESALNQFRGSISQVPPMYSSLKYKGQPLYELARAGINIERKSRKITIYRLEIIDCHPPEVTIEVECSKGTYIRSLAHDLGQALGCGAYLKTLVRTVYGPFEIKSSISLLKLEEASREGNFKELLYPIDYVLQSYHAVTISEVDAKSMKQGNILTLNTKLSEVNTIDNRFRAYGPDGRFLGILRFIPDSGLWQPEKVFI